MYGSAGTYSAGSSVFSGHVRRVSVGSGSAVQSEIKSYLFNSSSVQSGSVANEALWGVFTDLIPVGSGSALDVERVIGAITKSASIGSGSSLQAEIAGYEFNLTPIGSGGNARELTFALIASASIGSGSGVEADQVVGTLTMTITPVGSGSEVETLTREIALNGVPKFTVTPVSGNFEINIVNREGKEVKIFRTDQHNTSNQTVIEINSDTYSDPIVAGKNYRYKLAFFIDLSPQIVGQKSIYKIGKQ